MDISTPAGRHELGTRLQSAIMGAGFDSLPEFARKLGWSRALIYQYVSGRVLVQLDRLQQIAEATGKPLEWFLAADPNEQSSRAADLTAQLQQAEQRVRLVQDELAEERAARVHEERGSRARELELRGQLCRALRRASDATGLVEAAAAALELARRAGEPRAAMQAQLHMGHGWYLMGDLARAREVLLGTVQAAAEAAEPAVLNSARQELVRVLLQAGQVTEAQRVAEQLAQAELWWPRWSGLVTLAAISAQQARFEQAERQLLAAEEVIESAEETPARMAVARAYVLSNRVTLALTRGDYRVAADWNRQLRSLAGAASAIDQLRESELNAAIIDLRRGALAEAEEKLALLQEWSALADDRRLAVLCRVFESELRRRCGDLEAARQLAQTALDEALAGGQPHARVEASLALGQAYLAAGRPQEAHYQLERAEQLAAELGLARLQWQARLLIAHAGKADNIGELATRLAAMGFEDLNVEATLASWPRASRTGLEQAAVRAVQIDYFWGAHAALLELAASAKGRGKGDKSRDYLRRANQLSTASGAGERCPSIREAEIAVSGQAERDVKEEDDQ